MKYTVFGTCFVLLLATAAPARALPPPGQGGAARQRAKLGTRVAKAVRTTSQRTVDAFRNLHRRTPKVVRHGVATVAMGAITAVGIHSMGGTDPMTVKGMIATSGLVLTGATAAQQGWSTLRAAFPRRMDRVQNRLERSPVGPFFQPERPTLMQRLKRLFRRGD